MYKFTKIRLKMSPKRLFHGHFKLINGTKQFPSGSLIEANMYAYNYLHYRIKVWIKYKNCKCIFWKEIPCKKSIISNIIKLFK